MLYLYEIGRIQAITSSAHRIAATFLITPFNAAVHLPISSYTILWYALLVLSKLSLLFPSDVAEPLGVDNLKIRNVGIAIMQKIGSFSQGGDIWENCKKVIGSMLSWLEKSNLETRQSAPDKTGPMVLTRNASNNIRDYLSFDQTEHNPSLAMGGDVYIHQGAWPSIDFPSHLEPEAYIEAQPTVELDASLWEEMLESLTWPSSSIDNPPFFQ